MPHSHPQPQSSPRASPRSSPSLALGSAAFADGATIPRRFTADGDDVSPPLAWRGRVPGAASFALIVEDPDAPRGLFTHWLVWGLDPDATSLATGEEDHVQGENGFGRVGWGGPSPPPGKPHRYVFRLLALDTKLALARGATRAQLDRALEGHVLAEAKLIGMYGR